jgi:hypothetical protein
MAIAQQEPQTHEQQSSSAVDASIICLLLFFIGVTAGDLTSGGS